MRRIFFCIFFIGFDKSWCYDCSVAMKLRRCILFFITKCLDVVDLVMNTAAFVHTSCRWTYMEAFGWCLGLHIVYVCLLSWDGKKIALFYLLLFFNAAACWCFCQLLNLFWLMFLCCCFPPDVFISYLRFLFSCCCIFYDTFCIGWPQSVGLFFCHSVKQSWLYLFCHIALLHMFWLSLNFKLCCVLLSLCHEPIHLGLVSFFVLCLF